MAQVNARPYSDPNLDYEKLQALAYQQHSLHRNTTLKDHLIANHVRAQILKITPMHIASVLEQIMATFNSQLSQRSILQDRTITVYDKDYKFQVLPIQYSNEFAATKQINEVVRVVLTSDSDLSQYREQAKKNNVVLIEVFKQTCDVDERFVPIDFFSDHPIKEKPKNAFLLKVNVPSPNNKSEDNQGVQYTTYEIEISQATVDLMKNGFFDMEGTNTSLDLSMVKVLQVITGFDFSKILEQNHVQNEIDKALDDECFTQQTMMSDLCQSFKEMCKNYELDPANNSDLLEPMNELFQELIKILINNKKSQSYFLMRFNFLEALSYYVKIQDKIPLSPLEIQKQNDIWLKRWPLGINSKYSLKNAIEEYKLLFKPSDEAKTRFDKIIQKIKNQKENDFKNMGLYYKKFNDLFKEYEDAQTEKEKEKLFQPLKNTYFELKNIHDISKDHPKFQEISVYYTIVENQFNELILKGKTTRRVNWKNRASSFKTLTLHELKELEKEYHIFDIDLDKDFKIRVEYRKLYNSLLSQILITPSLARAQLPAQKAPVAAPAIAAAQLPQKAPASAPLPSAPTQAPAAQAQAPAAAAAQAQAPQIATKPSKEQLMKDSINAKFDEWTASAQAVLANNASTREELLNIKNTYPKFSSDEVNVLKRDQQNMKKMIAEDCLYKLDRRLQ